MVPRQDNEQGSPTEEEDVMKKIGEYTIKGSVLAEDSATVPKRITLFDGRFDTGYRITKFEIASKGNKTEDVQGVLATVDGLTPVEDWNFGDQRELAYGIWNFWDYNNISVQSFIDPDNLVVEDLYLYSTNSYRLNYIITLEKYDISDWQGALALVRNNAQSV